MRKKYEYTDETIEIDGHILHRIRSLMDFSNAHKGDLGGFIEKKKNLSNNGSAWVSDNACVYDNARIYGHVRISGDARVFENTRVYGNARIFNNAKVLGNAHVFNSARVFENALVYGNAQVYGITHIYGDAQVYGDAHILDETWVSGDTRVFGNAKVFNSSCIDKYSYIGKNAIIESDDDFYSICKIGSREDTTTFYKTKDSIYVSCGCFNDSIDEFEKQVKEVHNGTKYEKQYLAAITFVKTLFDMK